MKDHGKMNAQLLQPSYWQKIHLSAAVDFVTQFQAIDNLAEDQRSAGIEKILTAMAAHGYNNPANPVWALYSAILVQRN